MFFKDYATKMIVLIVCLFLAPMKLSTKGRYGVRAMVDLALHYDQGPVPIREISEKEGCFSQIS